MAPRIAAFLNDIGPTVLPRTDQKNLFGIVSKGSQLERYARITCACPLIPITRKKNAPTSSNKDVLDDALLYTDLLEQLRHNGVDAILVPAQQSSLRIVRWAHDNSITLLGTPHALQRTLEDKITFDALMRKYGIFVPQKITSEKNVLAVLQKRTGCGGSGTTILSARDIPRRSFTQNTLIRKHIDGTPLGISIVVDADGNYFCSALRRQCFFINKKNSPQLFGLQWMPTASFSKGSLSAIEHMTAQLINFFIDIHFVGVANIDFILAQDDAYVIECNPRFSGATPQVFSKRGLTSHPHAWRFLLNAFLHKKNSPFHDAHIPLSTYQGSLAYIDAEKKTIVSGSVPVGTYTADDKGIHVCQQKTRGSFFLLHELPKKTSTLKSGETICYILSDRPLFSKEGEATLETVRVQDACHNLFIQPQPVI